MVRRKLLNQKAFPEQHTQAVRIQDYFRSRSERHFPGFANATSTIAHAASRWPNAEIEIVREADRIAAVFSTYWDFEI